MYDNNMQSYFKEKNNQNINKKSNNSKRKLEQLKNANPPSQLMKYTLVSNIYEDQPDRLIRVYDGYMEHHQNGYKQNISVYQLKMFDGAAAYSDKKLTYSYDMVQCIVQKFQHQIRGNTNKKPLHKSILKIYGHYCQPVTDNLFLFMQKFPFPSLDSQLHTLSEIQFISVCQSLLQAFDYIAQQMPSKMKFFNLENCVKINRQTLQIKLLNFGFQLDALAQLSGFVQKWDIFKNPYSDAGQYVPGPDFYQKVEQYEDKQLSDIMSPFYKFPRLFDKHHERINLDLYSKPPGFVVDDYLWIMGVIIFKWFNRNLPISHTPVQANYLQIQLQLRKIAKHGYKASKLDLKDFKGIWRLISECLIKSKPPLEYLDEKQQIYGSIFECQCSYEVNPLKYWKQVFKNLHHFYIPYKYKNADFLSENLLLKRQKLSVSASKLNEYVDIELVQTIIVYILQKPRVIQSYLNQLKRIENRQSIQNRPLFYFQQKQDIYYSYHLTFKILGEISKFLRGYEKNSKIYKIQSMKDQNQQRDRQNDDKYVTLKLLKLTNKCEDEHRKYFHRLKNISQEMERDLINYRLKGYQQHKEQQKIKQIVYSIKNEFRQKIAKQDEQTQMRYDSEYKESQYIIVRDKCATNDLSPQFRQLLIKLQSISQKQIKQISQLSKKSHKINISSFKEDQRFLIWSILKIQWLKNLSLLFHYKSSAQIKKLQYYIQILRALQISKNYQKFTQYLYSKIKQFQGEKID